MALQSIVQKDLVAISPARNIFGSGNENMFWNNNYKTPICYSYFLTCVCVFTGMEHAILADAPKFTNEPNSTIYVRNGSPFLVPCEATGEEPLKIDWRNESILNARVVINTTNRGLWFMHGVRPLRSPKVHRVGIFRCMAGNTAGVVISKKFELNFICKYKICVICYDSLRYSTDMIHVLSMVWKLYKQLPVGLMFEFLHIVLHVQMSIIPYFEVCVCV